MVSTPFLAGLLPLAAAAAADILQSGKWRLILAVRVAAQLTGMPGRRVLAAKAILVALDYLAGVHSTEVVAVAQGL
jgi:hypothetical protein